MGFFLVKSPLALAVGEATKNVGEVIKVDDEDQAAHLVANGTLESAPEAPAGAADDAEPRSKVKAKA